MHPPERLSDLGPAAAAALEAARRRALDFLAEAGYALVVPPLAEHWETLAVGGGDLSARTFKMTDTLSGRTLGIRADHTPQIARFDAAAGLGGARRWAYCGPALRTRADLPWEGREIMQLGAELFGLEAPAGDFEMAQTAAGALRAAGLDGLRADFGHAGIFNRLVAGQEQAEELREAVCRRDAATLAERAAAKTDEGRTAGILAGLAEIAGPAETAMAAARDLLLGAVLYRDLDDFKEMLDNLDECVRRMVDAGWDAEVDLSELGGYSYHSGVVFAFYGEDFLAGRGGRYAAPGGARGESAAGFSADLRKLAGRAAAGEGGGA